ncbi:hypothetical protein [Kitasatospora purpeofusca]|uniref:hypothetical protein n=1 Tax=Kitasatospora purpeofusca TaxID=67352 RepID=UPI00224CD70C|nr:hypothetical protein [Kitasatospora purpeofusca]MCX4754288.1 hypothetical protein [Kitasatospora purpeofusca]WSR33720.1 hypothetical protein OG715_23730 [Kitasatospora purpeofusca]
MYDYDCDDYGHDAYDPEDAEDWMPGACDHCPGGEPIETPIGLLGCACLMGQGTGPIDCACGPDQD